MTNEQIAFVADSLLALCEKSPERPCYSDDVMRQKLKLAERREPVYGHLLMGRRDDPLLQDECRDVFEIAKLTERQSIVLHLRLEGYTFEEIGSRRGHSKQGAQNIFIQALKKLTHSFRVYPFRGLSDVYRWEVKRKGAGASRAA